MMDREVFGVSTADFDVQGFVSESLTGSTTASHVVAHLDEDLKRLDEDLKGEILLRQEGLLQSLDSLGDVDDPEDTKNERAWIQSPFTW